MSAMLQLPMSPAGLSTSRSPARLPPSCAQRHAPSRPWQTPRLASSRAAAGVACRAYAAQAPAPAPGGVFQGEDFYAILGLSAGATPRDIKRAYHALMREFHPDRMAGSADSGQLCALLNEIYETLSDEAKRATYDALAGFSASSVNPFLDTAYARDQVFVDEITCIGCGKCVRACPATFEIEDSKYGRARVISQGSDGTEDVQIAIESCPVDCIHWVSLPQLSLLETALATMTRVEVYVMMRYGRSGGNVFEAALKAWQRRQAAISARAVEAASRARMVDWNFWTASTLQYEEDAEARAARLDPTQRKIAGLAAAAARAARMWRLYSRRGGASMLSDSSSASMSSMDA